MSKLIKKLSLVLTLMLSTATFASAQANSFVQQRAELRALGTIDDWNCEMVQDLSTRTGRLAYVWSVGYVAGRLFPEIQGRDWPSQASASATVFSFDESMVDAVQGYCLLNPTDHLGEIRFTPRQEVAMGRLLKLLASYRWSDIALVQYNKGAGASVASHRTRSVMLDGFIAGQFTTNRYADEILAQGSAPWMCDAFEAMAANPELRLHEAAVEFFDDPANSAYHRASCERANYALLAAAGQLDPGLLQRARSTGQPIQLPRAIDPGPQF